jgi:hypothetical protein
MSLFFNSCSKALSLLLLMSDHFLVPFPNLEIRTTSCVVRKPKYIPNIKRTLHLQHMIKDIRLKVNEIVGYRIQLCT